MTNVAMPWAGGTRSVRIGVTELGWVTNVVYPDGTSESCRYDGLGNMTNYTDAAGRVTRYTWAPARHLVSAARSVGSATLTNSVEYDQQFNTVRVSDPLGRGVEIYVLDGQDRVVAVTNLEGQNMTVTWGVGPMVKSVKRFDNTTVSNSYDNHGRLTSVAYPGIAEEYGYSAAGRLATAENPAGAVENTYNVLGRLTASEGLGPNGAVAYGYDPAGNVTGVEAPGVTNAYAYDAAERVTNVLGVGGRFRLAYEADGGLLGAVTNSIGSGLRVEYGYDNMDRFTNIVWRSSNGVAVIRSFLYRYDAAGMVTNVVRETGERTVYGYDELDRLTNASVYSAGGVLTQCVTRLYDLAGNCTNETGFGYTNLYILGQGNRITGWGPNTTNLYDTAGNVTNLKYSATSRLDLTRDSAYRLTTAKTNGAVAETYGYDALGRRVWIASGGVTNWLVYDGIHVVAELNAAGAVQRTWSYGPGIDNPLAMTVSTGVTVKTYYYVKDHLGSVHALLDATNAIVETYEYGAFGKTTARNAAGQIIAESAVGNRICWQGREYSWKTGLYYFRARYYDPTTSRWLSNDPIGIIGGLNYSVFGRNNAVNYVDPSGLDTFLITISRSSNFEPTANASARAISSQSWFKKGVDRVVIHPVSTVAELSTALSMYSDKAKWIHISHGSEDLFEVGINGAYHPIGKKDLSQLPKGGFLPGATIGIAACWSAVGSDSIAQAVANEFGVPTWGAGSKIKAVGYTDVPTIKGYDRLWEFLGSPLRRGRGWRRLQPKCPE